MKTREFNPIEILKSNGEIAEYLAEAYQDPDPEYFSLVLADVVKFKGVANIAKATGLNRESLYKFIKNPNPKWDTVHKILRSLDIKLTVVV